MERKRFFTSRNIAFLAVFTALVVVLQTVGGSIKIGTTSLSLVLIPIVLGAVMMGPWVGAFLGGVFGLIVVIYGVTGADAFTYILFCEQPFVTIALCLVKGIAAGFVSGILYRAVRNKNRTVAVFLASVAAPVVNTGIFIAGSLLMTETITANFLAEGTTLFYFLFISCAGVNFLVELAVNIVASPAIYTVSRVIGRQYEKKHVRPAAAEGPSAEDAEQETDGTRALSDEDTGL